ncbi:uncharacterized protein LOC106657022 [Trichogramma pretiosum]|uniref:uncharacterized protein LOC106657022 n=1 Tax=Trichogramma pretiosum TaxID=7493 RepID=UPI0006C9C2FA|nr:uncharacterized protein LOC106657022 [Trichogramma pretiosum]XP_014233740.1 uncharacterized protein LOC106657022 [Trichogramma pretiosum]
MARDHPYSRSLEKSTITSKLKTFANNNSIQNNSILKNITQTIANNRQNLQVVQLLPSSVSDFGSNLGQQIQQQLKIHQTASSASQNINEEQSLKLLYIDQNMYEKIKLDLKNRIISKDGSERSNLLYKVISNQNVTEKKEKARDTTKYIGEQPIIDVSQTPTFIHMHSAALNLCDSLSVNSIINQNQYEECNGIYPVALVKRSEQIHSIASNICDSLSNNKNINKSQQTECDQIYPVALRISGKESKTKLFVDKSKIIGTEDFILGL